MRGVTGVCGGCWELWIRSLPLEEKGRCAEICECVFVGLLRLGSNGKLVGP